MKTDEQIAKEYAETTPGCDNSLKRGFLDGLRKGRELERDKALRFAEWTAVLLKYSLGRAL